MRRTGTAWLCCALSVLGGCGIHASGESRQPVSGTVTLDGRALEHGFIYFVPLSLEENLTPVGAEIVAGRFALDRSTGPWPGKYRISLSVPARLGNASVEPDSDTGAPMIRETLPAEYNESSTIVTAIPVGGEVFSFDLKSRSGPTEGSRREAR